MLQLSVVHYQVLLGIDTCDTDIIAINERDIIRCKLHFSYSTMYLAIMTAAGLSQGLF